MGTVWTKEKRRDYYRIYRVEHKDEVLAYGKKYKERNRSKIRADSHASNKRYNEELMNYATSHRSRWYSHDIQFLKDNAAIMTARDIALSLGRTYQAVLMKAHKQRIALMTPDKLYGRLTTGG